MAAYAALVSLMHIIDQIQLHPRPRISLDKTQVESLTEKVTFLQEFLEGYSHVGYTNEADALEMRIADAAYAAEDIIESHIVDQILAGTTNPGEEVLHIIEEIEHHPHISLDKKQVESLKEKVSFLQGFLEGYSHGGDSKEADDLESRVADAVEYIDKSPIIDFLTGREKVSCLRFLREILKARTHGEKITSSKLYEGLQKVIEDMDYVKKEVMEIKAKTGIQDHLHRSSTPANSLRSSFSTRQGLTVGLDDVLNEIMDKLTRQQSNLQIIPIVGMGGIGKTTLTRNIYVNPVIKEYFDICAWATISQEYNTREILREVLCQVNKEVRKDSSEMSENELGEILYKHLSGRRYLIVMDDMWSIEAWDKIKFFFPDYSNGSRIVITTRLSHLALQLTDSYLLKMEFLDEDKSWNLFCKTVFGEEGCPLELEEIGKKIAKGCRGLPLSIVVIGGLLAKSKHIREYWEHISENLNSVVNLEDNESCLKILHLSYNQLPVYLKPCILYMGFFPEDHKIRVSMLIKLWVAEGFLKPISGKSLEVVAQECFKDLIDRNLILVRQLGSTGKIKYCSIHDLLRDFCLREAEKQKFYNVIRQHSNNIPQGINTQRRIVMPKRTSVEEVLDALECMPHARSLISDLAAVEGSVNFGLLRILIVLGQSDCIFGRYFLDYFFHQLVNLRCLVLKMDNMEFPSSVYLLWNLQTLICGYSENNVVAPSEIWNMPQLRHVEFGVLYLPDPPSGHIEGRNDIVLENLQTLLVIYNFKCGEEVVKRIPNIKKLKIYYEDFEGLSHSCLNNLERLHKLESFECTFNPDTEPSGTYFLQNLTFPHSLKQLTFTAGYVHWDDIMEKIGSLPLLEKLKLIGGTFKKCKWETVEGQFCSLKFLLIQNCNLECWTTESTHFPRLEHLVLNELEELKEIPSGIGEIPTLRSIVLNHCTDSAVISAKKILAEQEELGEVAIQVRVRLLEENEALESLASSPNFQVESKHLS